MIGILGEDETDCRAVATLVRRLAEAPGWKRMPVKYKYPPTGGCAALRRKAAAYIRDLGRDGCRAAILVHDLDREGEATLREKLDAIVCPPGITRHICIPIEELEAWFWSDQHVLDAVADGLGKAALNPHLIRSPKEELIRLSRKAHGKASYSTNENESLAAKLDLALCAQRCPSFNDLQVFVRSLVMD